MKEPRIIRKSIQHYIEEQNPDLSIPYNALLKKYSILFDYDTELRRLEETGVPENKLEAKIYKGKLETLEILVGQILSEDQAAV